MKRYAFFLLILFCSVGLSAQKCKWTVNEKDAFSGGQKLESRSVTLKKISTHTEAFVYKLKKADDAYIMDLTYGISTGRKDKEIKNLKLSFKLSSGEIVEFTQLANQSMEVFCCYTTDFDFSIPIEKSDLEKLVASTITHVKVEFNDINVSFELKEKEQKKFTAINTCFLQEIQ